MSITRYNPCFECMNRYGRDYSEKCDNECDYAHAIKLRDANIVDLNLIITKKEAELAELKENLDDAKVTIS